MFQNTFGNVTIQMVKAAKRGLCLMASFGNQRILFDFVGSDPVQVPDGTNAYLFGNKLILVTRRSDMQDAEKETVKHGSLTLALYPGECIQMGLKVEENWNNVTLTLPHCVTGLNDENAPVDEVIFLFGDTHDENFLISRSVSLPPFIQKALQKANADTFRLMPMDGEIQALSREAAADPARDFCSCFYRACMEKTKIYAEAARALDPANVPDGVYIEIDGNDIIKNIYKNEIPEPQPEPAPAPGYEPEPAYESAPAPGYESEPAPAYEPEPAYESAPTPGYEPVPSPGYVPEPAPAYEPEPASEMSDDVKMYLSLAEQGVPEALYNMGVCCEKGDGIAQDPAQAVAWYEKAAQLGFAKAQYNLGVCKYTGFGAEADASAAAELFRAAAEAGDMYAQYNYGVCLFNGDGTPADLPAAAQWLQKAAAQGHAGAIKVLSEINGYNRRSGDRS
ncbi:MAG: SEL1-like repeat protein [Clostridia bacterium]|nr:SEL1-like repeat protein [Clostridia bacterium]